MRVTIEKLVHGGQGLARHEGQVVFVWNALPGEEVEVSILDKKKNYLEGVATTIHKPSPDRITPEEGHYLSSSPWQMMTYETEAYWKRAIAAETYSKFGGLILNEKNIVMADDPEQQFGYRNKIEFSFTESPNGSISLAFFERGQWKKIPAGGSLLAEPIINDTAKHILQWINAQKIPMRSLKAIIIRSDSAGHTIAALFIKDELSFPNYPQLSDSFVGFHLYYSTHKSPASVPTKLLYSEGEDHLTVELKSTKLTFGIFSFFQINTPLFNKALDDIAAFLHPKMPIIDFYSGVGAISLPLSHNRDAALLIDNNVEAIAYAKKNIELNNRKNCEAIAIPAEDITKRIRPDWMVILDPPRLGLHKNVVRELLVKKPPRIVYMSCDIATHARDMQLLSETYKISFLKLFNFFPRTPHIEGLAVLDRI